ncbi:MAG: hypothetical protein OJF49_002889 [Ktedonobacterales bacterium]|jgi:hypothetical protein|nr:MAG: hypothetical protein OJF49_002889 [Ktedonobacterales bacterium]
MEEHMAPPTTPAADTPASGPARGASLPRVMVAALLVGVAMQTVALFLPWEHLALFNSGVPGEREIADVPVWTMLVQNPGYAYAYILYEPALRHTPFALVVWHIFWQAALPLIGIVLMLVFFSWRRAFIRWPVVVAYALWLALTTAIAAQFIHTLLLIRAHQPIVPFSGLPWWQRLTWTSITISSGLDSPPVPAWGFYVLVAGLALSWLGWALAVVLLWRGRTAARSAGGEGSVEIQNRTPYGRRLFVFGAAALTLGALLWAVSFLALPAVVPNCQKPLIGAAASAIAECQRAEASASGGLYALHVIFLAFFVNPLPIGATPTFEQRLFIGNLAYLRDFVAPTLALITAPFALVAVWRRRIRRTASRWLGLWALLVIGVTLLFDADIASLGVQHPGSGIKLSFALQGSIALLLMAVGALLILAGMVLRWRRARQGDMGMAAAS